MGIPMNHLDPITNIQLEEGKKKVELLKDERIDHCTTVVLNKEDHTLGNLLKHQLLNNDKVVFSGYKVRRPLDHTVELKVITTGEYFNERRKLQYNPVLATLKGLEELSRVTTGIEADFEKELDDWRKKHNEE